MAVHHSNGRRRSGAPEPRSSRGLFRLSVVWVAAVLSVLAGGAHGADIWGAGGMDALCAESPVADTAALQGALGGAFEVVVRREGIDPAAIRKVEPVRLMPVLQRVVEQRMGPLELLSDGQFATDGPCVLFLDEAALAEVDREFDLHGLWMVRAPIVGEGETHLAMHYMLLGRGRLVVGYPRRATVRVRDYALFTGRYDYAPYMAMDVVSTPARRAMVGLRTLATPSADFQPFTGPLGAAIGELELVGGKIIVRYRVLGGIAQQLEVPHPPITRR